MGDAPGLGASGYTCKSGRKYLWWFTALNALLYSTKEVSFIYTAVFGSFLVIRLLAFLWRDGVIQEQFARLRQPLLLVALGVLFSGWVCGRKS